MRRLAGVALVLGTIVVPSLAADAQQQQHPVTIVDDAYDPPSITINVGDSVTWTDEGDKAHSVTSTPDGAFDSTDPNEQCTAILGGDGCLSKGDQFTVTFTNAGTFSYHCRVQNMAGVVIVQSGGATTTSASSSSTTTTTTTANSTSETTTSLASDQPTITQAPLPSVPTTSHVALPKSIIRAKNENDVRPWAFVAIVLAGGTALAGIALVRSGRVPLG